MISTSRRAAPDSAALPASGGRWRIAAAFGHAVSGYLPAWAENDPSEEGVPIEEFGVRLSDVSHCAEFEGQTVRVRTSDRRGEQPAEEQILYGSIDCHPYAEDPEPRVPVVNINITNGCWVNDLDPAGLAAFIAKLRAQVDRLEGEVLPALVAACADWEVNGRARRDAGADG
ncbi:hypothetical protein OG896_29110 [Streptomyces sp. NBC_00669]|uniref:DUF6907 domain-containing protein n=1 Tax=Streptomyces sp. NBC_00669 TaxID=2976011 RepID=UPI002E312185|nr:hypothetical protein [Streptomyces sp. NBC_00669]